MGGRALGNLWAQVGVIVAACAVVYWAWIGGWVRPFDFSEGHRVVPAWTMLETGDWLRVRMFETTYLRKPPGMAWAIAASSWALGETEFAARAVSAASATAMGLIAWVFVRRWMGSGPWALGAGLAQALMPLMWAPGRTAEIEMLNNLGTQLMAFGVVDVLWRRWFADAAEDGISPRRRGGRGGMRGVGVGCAAAGMVIAALAKGPASLPVLAGVLGGACVLARSPRPVFRWRVWAAVVLAACVLVPVGVLVLEANHDAGAVREDVAGQFLWSRERIGGVLALALLAAVSALPMSLAVVFVFGRRARMDAAADEESRGAFVAARLCAFGWIGTLVVCVLAGVSNARYAMPGAVLLAPVVGYVVRGFVLGRAGGAGGLEGARLRAAGAALLGRPVVWAVVLVIAGVASGGAVLVRRGDADAGLHAARAFGAALPDGAVVWADELVESRPDVLLYARRGKAGALRPVWAKSLMARGELPAPGSYVLLMDGAEGVRYAEAIKRGRLERVAGSRVREREFVVWRVVE